MSSPPLIAHIVHRFDYGGLENGVANLINGLPHDLCRHAIVTLSGYSAFAGRIGRDVDMFSIEKRPGKDFGAYARLWRLLKKLAPAVVHTRNVGTLDCSVVAAAAGVPVRIHGMHGWDVSDLHGENVKYRMLYRLCNASIQRYVAVSRHLADWLERAVKVRPAKIRQIYNGVDMQRFRPPDVHAGDVLPPEIAHGAGRVVFASVGRMAAVKNHELLVRAFAALVRRQHEGGQRLRLAIVGDGPLRAHVVNLARELGIDTLCWFPGARDDVAAILAAIDVFVLPSLNEGISNTVLEAMAAARPVVATDVGGNPELVEHAKTGYLVPVDDVEALADSLGRYCEDGRLIREHGAAGRRRVGERFSLSRMLDDYQRLYEEALAAAA